MAMCLHVRFLACPATKECQHLGFASQRDDLVALSRREVLRRESTEIHITPEFFHIYSDFSTPGNRYQT